MLDDFIVEVLALLSDLHDCNVYQGHTCKYIEPQINGKGKRRTFCTKYGQPIKRVRHHCIDTFQGFNDAEMQEIMSQHKDGKCELVINGVAA